jgi:hypothetical protein
MVDGTGCYLATTLLTRAEALVSLDRLAEAPLDAERALEPRLALSCSLRPRPACAHAGLD